MKKISALALLIGLSLSACDLLNETGTSSSSGSSSSGNGTGSNSSSSYTSTQSNTTNSSSSIATASDLVSVNLSLGGATSSNPSYLDADEMVSYKSSLLTSTVMQNLDLVFNDGIIYSPSQSNRITNGAECWFVKVPVNYESIKKQSEVVALYEKYSNDATQTLTPKAGDVIVIFTSLGKARLMKISTVTNNAEDMTIIGAKVK